MPSKMTAHSPEHLAQFIQRITEELEKSGNGKYIFRGESMRYGKRCLCKGGKGPVENEKPLASGLYRKFCTGENSIEESGIFSIFRVEKDIAERIQRHFSKGTDPVEILTKFQHHGGKTALIDFSYDIHIALFFACDSHFSDDGYLYCFPKSQFDQKDQIDYDRGKDDKDVLIDPASKDPRVIFQGSVFVHSYKGFLNAGDSKEYVVPASKKMGILRYLDQYFNINAGTVYNDMHGFIQNQDRHFDFELALYRGIDKTEKSHSKGAILAFSEAIKLNPYNSEAYCLRGLVKSTATRSDYAGAIADFDKAIELDPQYALAYYLRGGVKTKRARKDYAGAIADFDKAIELDPQYTMAYRLRGEAKSKATPIDYDGAIADFDKAIELDPDYALAYDRRGAVKEVTDDLTGAKADYQKVLDIYPGHKLVRRNLKRVQKELQKKK